MRATEKELRKVISKLELSICLMVPLTYFPARLSTTASLRRREVFSSTVVSQAARLDPGLSQ